MRGNSLHRFILVSVSGVCIAFVLLTVGWLVSFLQLREMKERLFYDSQSVSISYQLELLVRGAQDLDRVTSTPLLTEARRILEEMPSYSTTTEEKKLLDTLNERFKAWESGGGLPTLLQSINEHRSLNEDQMRDSMVRSTHIETILYWTVSPFLALTVGTLAWGGWKLWSRIFEPILQLSSVAEAFGQGAMWKRTPIKHDDELGALCNTFNNMADALSERERDRLNFVAGVAHDLKTPLVVIGGAANLLQREKLSPSEQLEWLGRVARNARVLEDMIADFTDATQAETGQLVLRRESFDLGRLCERLIEEQSILPGGERLRFERDKNCFILGDHQRLERLVRNLVSNALKYSDDGDVTVSLWRHGDELTLGVRDLGEGMTPEELKQLFRPYSRLDRSRRVAGTGLGLVSVQKIAEAHGARLSLHSELGKGTLVEICFKSLPLLTEVSSQTGNCATDSHKFRQPKS